ncbi:hypothetical protein EON83_21380 [bacterium]|nr:MAG: hypothetical protein EON83_21380 [bacterium]
MAYTYDQPYSLDGTEGQTISVYQSTDLVTPLTSYTSDTNGRGKVALTVSNTVATTLYFVRASDSKRLAVVTVEPREIASLQVTTPPNVTQIRQEMDDNSTKLAKLDANVSTRLATAGYTAPTTPPTVLQIRQDLDANSTKLANLDALVSSRSTFAGGAVASVTSPVTLTAGEHTNIATDVRSGLTAQGYTTGRAILLDVLDGLVNAVKLSIEGGILGAVKSKTDNLPAVPASKTDVQVTVNPTAVTVNPTPVTVNPTLTAGQVAQLGAIASTSATLDGMITGGAFTAPALANAPVGSGGGGGYTGADRTRDNATSANVLAVRERLAEQVAEPAPIVAVPAFTPPAGMVRVLLRPTFLGSLVDANVSVYYADQETPELAGGVEMVKHYATFKKDATKFGEFYGLLMPVGSRVFFANDKNAALNRSTGAFRVTATGTGWHYLDDLIEAFED